MTSACNMMPLVRATMARFCSLQERSPTVNEPGETPSSDVTDYLERQATESATKFVYFMVALTFSILGLSIQTTTSVTWLTQISWTALLISAMSGIFRIQWEPPLWHLNAEKIRAERIRSSLESIKSSGRPLFEQGTRKRLNPEDLIKNHDEFIQGADKQFTDTAWKQEWRYRIHLWSFVFGIFGLAIDKIF